MRRYSVAMHAAEMQMQVRQVQVNAAREKHQHAEKESQDETDQVKISPCHDVLLSCFRGRPILNSRFCELRVGKLHSPFRTISASCGLWPQRIEQAVREPRRIEN